MNLFIHIEANTNDDLEIKSELDDNLSDLEIEALYETFTKLGVNTFDISTNSPSTSNKADFLKLKTSVKNKSNNFINITKVIQKLNELGYESSDIDAGVFQDKKGFLLRLKKQNIKKTIYLSTKRNHTGIYIIDKDLIFNDLKLEELNQTIRNRVLTTNIEYNSLNSIGEVLDFDKSKFLDMYKLGVFNEIKKLKYREVGRKFISKWNSFLKQSIKGNVSGNYPTEWTKFTELLDINELESYIILPSLINDNKKSNNLNKFLKLLGFDPYFNEYKGGRDKYLGEYFEGIMNHISGESTTDLSNISKKALSEVKYEDEKVTLFRDDVINGNIILGNNDFNLIYLGKNRFIDGLISGKIFFSDDDFAYIYDKKYGLTISEELDYNEKIEKLREELRLYIENNNKSEISNLLKYFYKTPINYNYLSSLIILFGGNPNKGVNVNYLKELIKNKQL